MDTTAAGIFIKGRRILFEKRRKDEDNYAGLFAAPGGHKRKKETARKALAREMKEELGIKVKKAKFIGKIKDTDPTSKKLYSHNYFLCRDYEGRIRKTYEQKKLEWLDAEKIKKLYAKGKLAKADYMILKKRGLIA